MIRWIAWICTLATAVLAVSPNPTSERILAVAVYALAGTAALRFPIATTVQTVLGAGLAAGLILGDQPWPLVLSVVLGTILAAEMFGLYWTETLSFRRERPLPVRRPIQAALVGVVAFGLVSAAAVLPGPTGVGAVVLAAAAVMGAAAVLYGPSRSG